jgi:hypothetical protein
MQESPGCAVLEVGPRNPREIGGVEQQRVVKVLDRVGGPTFLLPYGLEIFLRDVPNDASGKGAHPPLNLR